MARSISTIRWKKRPSDQLNFPAVAARTNWSVHSVFRLTTSRPGTFQERRPGTRFHRARRSATEPACADQRQSSSRATTLLYRTPAGWQEAEQFLGNSLPPIQSNGGTKRITALLDQDHRSVGRTGQTAAQNPTTTCHDLQRSQLPVLRTAELRIDLPFSDGTTNNHELPRNDLPPIRSTRRSHPRKWIKFSLSLQFTPPYSLLE